MVTWMCPEPYSENALNVWPRIVANSGNVAPDTILDTLAIARVRLCEGFMKAKSDCHRE